MNYVPTHAGMCPSDSSLCWNSYCASFIAVQSREFVSGDVLSFCVNSHWLELTKLVAGYSCAWNVSFEAY